MYSFMHCGSVDESVLWGMGGCTNAVVLAWSYALSRVYAVAPMNVVHHIGTARMIRCTGDMSTMSSLLK